MHYSKKIDLVVFDTDINQMTDYEYSKKLEDTCKMNGEMSPRYKKLNGILGDTFTWEFECKALGYTCTGEFENDYRNPAHCERKAADNAAKKILELYSKPKHISSLMFAVLTGSDDSDTTADTIISLKTINVKKCLEWSLENGVSYEYRGYKNKECDYGEWFSMPSFGGISLVFHSPVGGCPTKNSHIVF